MQMKDDELDQGFLAFSVTQTATAAALEVAVRQVQAKYLGTASNRRSWIPERGILNVSSKKNDIILAGNKILQTRVLFVYHAVRQADDSEVARDEGIELPPLEKYTVGSSFFPTFDTKVASVTWTCGSWLANYPDKKSDLGIFALQT
ncbi:hypothetical protein Tco_0559513 [Tanacetum coccineum]